VILFVRTVPFYLAPARAASAVSRCHVSTTAREGLKPLHAGLDDPCKKGEEFAPGCPRPLLMLQNAGL
jgi:hypothetical protein